MIDFDHFHCKLIYFQHEVNAHKRLESSPTMSGRLEDEEMRLLRPFSNFLRKIGLQQRRKRHVIKHRAQDFLSGISLDLIMSDNQLPFIMKMNVNIW